jgi:hypothetical protein
MVSAAGPRPTPVVMLCDAATVLRDAVRCCDEGRVMLSLLYDASTVLSYVVSVLCMLSSYYVIPREGRACMDVRPTK